MNIVASPLLCLERDIERLREILRQVVGRSCLQRLAVAHHRFDGISMMRAREFFLVRLESLNDRKGNKLLGEPAIYTEHSYGFLFSILISRVCRVTFLPKEFCRPKEQPCPHFPAHDIAPLIN